MTRDYRERPLGELLEDIAGSQPVPAAGSTVAATAAMAAGLVSKVAARSRTYAGAEPLSIEAGDRADELAALISKDAENYAAAMRLEPAERKAALAATSSVPMSIARAGEWIAQAAATLVAEGNPNLKYDAAAAADLAASAAAVAASLVAANSAGHDDETARAAGAADRARSAAENCRTQL